MENQRRIIWSAVNTDTGEIKNLNALISSEADSFEVRNIRTGEAYRFYAGGDISTDKAVSEYEWYSTNVDLLNKVEIK